MVGNEMRYLSLSSSLNRARTRDGLRCRHPYRDRPHDPHPTARTSEHTVREHCGQPQVRNCVDSIPGQVKTHTGNKTFYI
jgi:hypothetical protein